MRSSGLSKYLLQVYVGVAALLLAVGWTQAASAAATVKFNADLSLTGGTSCPVSELDPIPDPGCPSPPPRPISAPFAFPKAVATDANGNIYVASFGQASNGSEGRIDVFDSSGYFITQVADPDGPQNVAVDSDGVMYVVNQSNTKRIVKYVPTVYGPAVDAVAYGNPPVLVLESSLFTYLGLAINRDNDHLFANLGTRVGEWKSHAEGGDALPDPVPAGSLCSSTCPYGPGLAIDTGRGRIYASSGLAPVIKIYELSPPHNELGTIDGSTTPGGFGTAEITLAVDEETGHLYVYDGGQARVDELTETGGFVGLVEHGFIQLTAMNIAVDNGANSPNGALNPDGRFLYVPSHPTGIGHSFAFGPAGECAPEAKELEFANVTEREAELRAMVNPCNLPTAYTFEYTPEQVFESEEFASAVKAGSGQLPATQVDELTRAGAAGLDPDTAYRFRVIATNELGSDEAEGRFRTYPAAAATPCANDPVRLGLSALLPDCRSYELVTPADTNARSPIGIGFSFTTWDASPAGDKLSFVIEGGLIPGSEGTGSLHGDPYLSVRGATGWNTANSGPTGAETVFNQPESVSRDQGYSFWTTGSKGSAAVDGKSSSYVRYPDGHSELIGRGSLGTESRSVGRQISEDGSHIIFQTGAFPGTVAKQLEENAPPDGTQAIYDRTADEVTHVVSLLPGDVVPAAGQNAAYRGTSLDGNGVAFAIGSKLYLRYANDETYEVADGVTFVGISAKGNRVFYLQGGQLRRFDVLANQNMDFNSTGSVLPVYISDNGNAAFFVSTSVLTTKANGNGDQAGSGSQNLYLSQEGALSFVARVTERDVLGEFNGIEQIDGLGLWLTAIGSSRPGSLGAVSARTTADGTVLLFESRAPLGDVSSNGKAQIYRYDFAAGGTVECVSCNPTELPPSSDASLQTIRGNLGNPEPLGSYDLVSNLSADGRRAVFQSSERLVAGDTDGLQDVYQWEEQGVGSCKRSGGCIDLISSGQSDRIDYLYAVSESGDDVFFRSSDLLVGADADETPSIYDARVGGGFPEPVEGACQGEGCRPGLEAAPLLPSPLTPALGAADNVPKKCPKGKRKVKRNGKVRCVKKKSKHHGRSNSNRGARK